MPMPPPQCAPSNAFLRPPLGRRRALPSSPLFLRTANGPPSHPYVAVAVGRRARTPPPLRPAGKTGLFLHTPLLTTLLRLLLQSSPLCVRAMEADAVASAHGCGGGRGLQRGARRALLSSAKQAFAFRPLPLLRRRSNYSGEGGGWVLLLLAM